MHSLHFVFQSALASIEIHSHLSVAAYYLLSSFCEAAQGAIQHAHSVPNTRVPALNPSLVIQQKGFQSVKHGVLRLERAHSWWLKTDKKLQ